MKLTKIALIFYVELMLLHGFLPESVTNQSALMDLYTLARHLILG
jgi:hypothetical protein